MEDEQNKMPAPARSHYKFYKILTITLLSFVLLVIAGFATVEATSSSPFCGTCHEMNPEYNTWKASSHSTVACKTCHIQPGVVSYAKAKANGLVELYKKTTDDYTAPIQMIKEVPNSTCESCHNMKTRETSAKGDIIIPHDKHLAKDISCVTCHSGIAHGNVADRNVTYKTDYDKWSGTLGKQMMSNVKFTQPKMEDCIKCHETRQVSTECKTCHSTGMKPKSHDAADFKNNSHGQLAEKDIQKCNSCHSTMSQNELKNLEPKSASDQFFNTGTAKTSNITAQEYAKENTYCQKCHATRPQSHDANFIDAHGALAKKDKQKCSACHNEQKATSGTITSTGLVSNAVSIAHTGSAPACATCHPASHEGKDFRASHPINLTGITKPNATCYTCHSKPKCETCHKP